MIIHATPFSLVYGIEAILPIKFEVESLRVAVGTRLNNSQSLKNKLTALEELNNARRRTAQHIEAIQKNMKIIFDKCNKKSITTWYDGYDSGWKEKRFLG